MSYTVKSGDTMAKIAAAHGVSVGALIRANPQVEDPGLIFPGQKLNVPDGAGARDVEGPATFTEQYRVRSGDTMKKIARAFGVSLSDLVAANPQITNPDVIRVGEIVHVPSTGPKETMQKVTTPPGGSGPEWYRIARRELKDGIVEFAGEATHNPRIIEYHATVETTPDANEVPWCSSFVNWCMEQAEVRGTDSATARSWERWGKKLSEPQLGAVAVFWRESKSSGKGHVGFFVEETSRNVSVLGGNQGDQVSIAPQSKARLLGYRWPKP